MKNQNVGSIQSGKISMQAAVTASPARKQPTTPKPATSRPMNGATTKMPSPPAAVLSPIVNGSTPARSSASESSGIAREMVMPTRVEVTMIGASARHSAGRAKRPGRMAQAARRRGPLVGRSSALVNRAESWPSMAPPSCSGSEMVTARR